MKKKLSIKLNHYIFILSLILISCVGVGFSSWIIEGNNNSANGDVNINVGEVNGLYSDAISIDTSKPNNGIEPLYYTTKGFINKDSSSTNVPNSTSAGFYNIYFQFDINKCRNYFKDYNSLYIEFNLSTTNVVELPIATNFTLSELSISSEDSFFNYPNKKVSSNDITFSDQNNTYIKGSIRLDHALRNFSNTFNALTYIEIKPRYANKFTSIYTKLKDKGVSFNLSVGLGAYNV